jgi:hypothetical protein
MGGSHLLATKFVQYYMTEKDKIEHIITTGRSPMTFNDYTNYIFLVAPIGFVAIGFSMMYNYTKFHSGLPMLTLSILFISFGIFFTFFVLNRLNDNITFRSISTISDDNMDNVAEKLRQNFKLQRIDINKGSKRIVAFTKITAFSWGEQLTLVFDKGCILINSRPSGSRQPITILKDRQNIKKLKQML